jgi:putative membrane protein
MLEWGVAMVFGADMGQAYLGTQGDEWDAQKDMALATLGGLLAMLLTAFVHWRDPQADARGSPHAPDSAMCRQDS